MDPIVERAQGCLLGQLAGDELGGLVEFSSAADVKAKYPNGVRELADGGYWDTIAGQPTDDSEMALLLARMLVEENTYSAEKAMEQYRFWLDSGPFDVGGTIRSALGGNLSQDSQANGALMRISPLGIFGVNYDLDQVAEWAKQDAALTHPHLVCQQTNVLFAMAISHVTKTGISPGDLYEQVRVWAEGLEVDKAVSKTIESASETPPIMYPDKKGWVLFAFGNALWQLLHAPNLEEAVVDTVMLGGDTDTNAAICGALLGAVYGIDAIPGQWKESVLNCRPESGKAGVRHPRPECFWPADALELAEGLVS